MRIRAQHSAKLSRWLIKNLDPVGIVLLPSEDASDLNSVVNWAIDDSLCFGTDGLGGPSHMNHAPINAQGT